MMKMMMHRVFDNASRNPTLDPKPHDANMTSNLVIIGGQFCWNMKNINVNL